MDELDTRPTTTEAAHSKAYRLIKQAILERGAKLNPLTELRLANELGLSRTPIREALRLLEKEGLLEYERARGWRLALITPDDLREIFELKLILEPLATARAAERASPDERARLLQIAAEMAQAAADGAPDRWLEADLSFHRLLLGCLDNARWANAIEGLNEQWWRVHVAVAAMAARIGESSQEHRLIAQAVADSNPELASSTMYNHLARLQQTLQHDLESAFALHYPGL